MSDTFDHELEAFERWENGERDGQPDIEFTNDDVFLKEDDLEVF